MAKKDTSDKKIIAQNRKARFNYTIEETIEAGVALEGSEVKSLREGKANIADAYASEKKEELYLMNCYIAEYKGANQFNHKPKRPRKLLLHKREINRLIGKLKTRGITLVPLSIYFNEKNRVKVELGLASGKKQHDKRETEKKRDWDREKGRILRDK